MKRWLAIILASLFFLPLWAGICDTDFAMEPGEMLNMNLIRAHKKKADHNPLYTQRFGADPGVMEYKGRLYVYMTNDVIEYSGDGTVKENTYAQIRHISCISSDDLVNWTDHGLIPVAGKAGIAKWASNSWAPCAAYKTIDGKDMFFLYFCNGGNGIGVLTADSPAGPWHDPLAKPLVSRSTPNCADVVWLFDPAVMVDDDGTGYLAFGGGVPAGNNATPGTARIVRLGNDMISLDGEPQRIDAPYLFEDSGINRINGVYVYSYCSNWQTQGNSLRLTSGAIQYMTSDQPMGPYAYAGELFPNQGQFFGLYGNNHHSIAQLNGRLFLFYHNRSVEKDMNITGNYRSPQLDEIFVDAQGSMKQVKGTMRGVEQLKPLNPYQLVSACTMSSQAGTQTILDTDTLCLSGNRGSWIRCSGVDFGTGCSELVLRAASSNGSHIYILLDGLTQPVAARVDIQPGMGFMDITVPFHTEGQHDIYFVMDGETVFAHWFAVR